MRREEDVVLTIGRAELRWRLGPDRQPKLRQHPRVIAEHSVGVAHHIAARIGDQEAVAMLEREQPARRRNRAGRRGLPRDPAARGIDRDDLGQAVSLSGGTLAPSRE
jgi:hypothetical protein